MALLWHGAALIRHLTCFFAPGAPLSGLFGRELNILRGEHYARGGVFWPLAHFNRWRSPHVLLQEA
jgi:hypothetical protein